MKYFVVAAMALSLAACGTANRNIAKFTGYSTSCIKGVTYIQFPSGAVEMRTVDDKLVSC